jgi:hypothetical protein
MTSRQEIIELGERLDRMAGVKPQVVYDTRIDFGGMDDDPSLLTHVKHQALFRAYQGRYVLLPTDVHDGSILCHLKRRYDPDDIARIDALRPGLEAELIGPLVDQAAAAAAAGGDCATYVAALVPELRAAKGDRFLEFLDHHPQGADHYRNFLVQSSADLLAEASASAMGVVGEFGEPQSALFRILIDEFGYGVHAKKHSVLYRQTLKSFGLDVAYNAYWPVFDTAALELHNVIHYLFQNPGRLFQQIGFLLFAETSYQRSTARHFRYLSQFHPQADARYFGEHAHIDLHHTTMVVDEVVAPLVARFGPEVGQEIVIGAELTRAVFQRAGDHMLAVSQAFDAAAAQGRAIYGIPPSGGPIGRCVTPGSNGKGQVQVGGLGMLSDVEAFAAFPPGAVGREVRA